MVIRKNKITNGFDTQMKPISDFYEQQIVFAFNFAFFSKYRILTVILKMFLFEKNIEFYEKRDLPIGVNTFLC